MLTSQLSVRASTLSNRTYSYCLNAAAQRRRLSSPLALPDRRPAQGIMDRLGVALTNRNILTKVQRPDRVDDRAFYMNVAMNAVAKEGYEFAGMTPDEIVMKRPVAR